MDKIRKKVLIIEDDFGLRLILTEKLGDLGIETITAQTGLNAVYKVKKELPDLVLLDVMLPGEINGFDVLKQIKADKSSKNIPVFIMTNLETERNAALKMGATDYILKNNIKFDDLVAKIQKYLE